MICKLKNKLSIDGIISIFTEAKVQMTSAQGVSASINFNTLPIPNQLDFFYLPIFFSKIKGTIKCN